MPSLGTPGGAPAEKEKREQLERNVIEMAERMYGYIPPAHKEKLWIDMPKGQNIAGYGVGILHLDDVWYPMVPGNVVNAWTYDFPVHMKAVKGLDTPTLHSGSPRPLRRSSRPPRSWRRKAAGPSPPPAASSPTSRSSWPTRWTSPWPSPPWCRSPGSAPC